MGDDIRMCFIENDGQNKQTKNDQQESSPVQEEKKEEVKLFKVKPPKVEPISPGKGSSNVELKDYQSAQLQHIEKKNAHRDFDRYMNLYRREYDDLQAEQSNIKSALREGKLEYENNLARELDIIKRREYRDAKMRQYLRENSSDLRELDRKLKAAYINKELAAQIAQKEAEKMNEKIRESEAHKIMRQAWIDQKEYQKQSTQEEMIKKAHYKQELQEQLIMREKMKRHLYEEFLREKKLLDDIVQRIQDEDEREAYERLCRMKKTRAEMVAFKNAQDTFKKKRMDEIDEENRKIEEYLMTKTAGEKARQLEQAQKELEREKVIEKIARKLCEVKEKQREREEIIADLQHEEQIAIVEQRHKDDLEKQLRIRLETKQCLAQQMAERKERQRQAIEEDRLYKEELLAKLAEDARLEQLSEQKRRMKMLQLKRDVQAMMKERREQMAAQFQLSIEIEKDDQRKEEQRRRIVEEERIKMLQEHVKNLIGYLPKGLLKPEDLPHLGSEIVNHVFKEPAKGPKHHNR